MTDFVIEANNLSKYYGKRLALNDVSFKLKKGTLTGLLGENGAGKSTTMNLLSGYLGMSNGSVLVNGINMLEEPIEAKRQIGYLAENPSLYLDMTVSEYLEFIAKLKQLSKANIKNEQERICGQLDLTEVASRLIGHLSKGYKQRVGLGGSLIGSPPLLILDEPSNGLDPTQIIQMRKLITSLKENHTILLSSHILKELEPICDDALILHKGQLVAHGSFKNLLQNKHQSLVVKIDSLSANKVEKELAKLSYVNKLSITTSDEEDISLIELECHTKDDVRSEIFANLVASKAKVYLFKPNENSLESIFTTLTTKGES